MGYSVTSQSRRPIRDAIFHPDQIDIKGIPRVTDNIWKRHNDSARSPAMTAKCSTRAGGSLALPTEEDQEVIDSWNQLMEFDNRVTRAKEPNYKYPKIEY